MSWENIDKSRQYSGHYSVMRSTGDAMQSLREMFPDAKADDLNFVLFGTSGIHGTYATIEGAKEEDMDVTFLVVHPRLVAMRYGNVQPTNDDDWQFLKDLRESSLKAVLEIANRR